MRKLSFLDAGRRASRRRRGGLRGVTSAPAVHARAKANLANLFSDEDYPAAALAAREQGSSSFTLDVGANGRVAGCTITRSSGSAALDSTTCRLLRSRARFTPAVDASGATVADRSPAGWLEAAAGGSHPLGRLRSPHFPA